MVCFLVIVPVHFYSPSSGNSSVAAVSTKWKTVSVPSYLLTGEIDRR